jgi:hypothetical protein
LEAIQENIDKLEKLNPICNSSSADDDNEYFFEEVKDKLVKLNDIRDSLEQM